MTDQGSIRHGQRSMSNGNIVSTGKQRSAGTMWRKLLAVSVFSALTVCFAQGLDTRASKDDWEEINFEFNSAVLSDGFPSLLRLAELLKANPGYRVRVEGHADGIGSDRYNEKLGMQRATTVRDFLVKY